MLKADLTISAGLHFRYGASYNEFSVQQDPDSFKQKLESSAKSFNEVWDSVRSQVETVIEFVVPALLRRDGTDDFAQRESKRITDERFGRRESCTDRCGWNASERRDGVEEYLELVRFHSSSRFLALTFRVGIFPMRRLEVSYSIFEMDESARR